MAGFSGWQVALLHAAGAPLTANNLKFLNAWQQAEGGSASFNPMNTTQPANGAGSYNSVGVRNYRSPQQGVQATAQTLENGHYNTLLQMLRSGRATAQQMASDLPDLKTWGTGSGVLRVLGAGPVSVPQTGSRILASSRPSAQQPQQGGGASAFPMLALANEEAAGGQDIGTQSLMALALARQQAGAAQQTYGPQPTTGGLVASPVPPAGGKVGFIGNLQGENPRFVRALSAAAAAVGGTQIRVTSGYRSPQHNAAVGGVPDSNHTTGHAMDGDIFIPGKGWVPLGVALKGIAPRFGLRSGDQPGFFNGGPDPVHVDDGFNLQS